MKARTLILYWVLLLAPTALISAGAFILLRHEQERIGLQAGSYARDRAGVIADSIQSSVNAVEQELTASMLKLGEDSVQAELMEWQKRNPLVRNVFVWKEKEGLRYPAPATAVTQEDTKFIARYEPLFSGLVAWKQADMDVAAGGSQAAPAPASSYSKLERGRKDMAALAKSVQSGSPGESGWIPWFADNQLHLLGWVRQKPDGPVYGMELESMILLSRVVGLFPADVPAGTAYALIDGSGAVFHQAGSVLIDGKTRPEYAVSLSPVLPHWQVATFMSPDAGPGKAGSGFLLLGGLLIAAFAAAIVLGGVLLTLQAHRNMMDARRKTSFVSNVSHELKTPLTSIRMYAELLKEGRVKDEAKKSHYLGVIVTESQRLTRLVNNVLDFARLEEGRKKYRVEELDLCELIRQFGESHEPRLTAGGLRLNLEMPRGPFAVQCDRDALDQALLNLADNAVKYAAGGGEVTIRLEQGADACRLSVMDRGPGIPPQHREKIFEKFHRVDDSLAAKQPGSGLGLTIARNLLRGMGCDLVYEPRDGGGSSFIVVIPSHGAETGKETAGS